MSSSHFQYGMQASQGVIWYSSYLKESETLHGSVFFGPSFFVKLFVTVGTSTNICSKSKAEISKTTKQESTEAK